MSYKYSTNYKKHYNKEKSYYYYSLKYNINQVGLIDGKCFGPYDKALIRCNRKKYKPNYYNFTSNPEKTLFVGRLSPNTTEEDLKDYMSEFGVVKNCRLIVDIVTGLSKGYGFVEYKTKGECSIAYKKSHKTSLDGQIIHVDFERSRLMSGFKPRRLGGGFGGFKESGQLRFGCRFKPFKSSKDLSEEFGKLHIHHREDEWKFVKSGK